MDAQLSSDTKIELAYGGIHDPQVTGDVPWEVKKQTGNEW